MGVTVGFSSGGSVSRERREQGVDLVARVLRVVDVAAQRQRVPHRRAGDRRAVVEQLRRAVDSALDQGDFDVAVGHVMHSMVPPGQEGARTGSDGAQIDPHNSHRLG